MILRRLLLCLPALAWMHAAGAPAGAEPPLLLVNAVYPPFVNPAGDPQGEGLHVEIAREALRRVGRELRIELLPWQRVLLMLEKGQADLTTSISRDADRDRYLYWTQSYREGAHYQFYTRKGATLQIKTLNDLNGHRLGTVQGFTYPEAITGQPGVVIDSARDVGMLARKLQAGRIDVMVVTGIRGAWEIREAGLADMLLRQPYQHPAASTSYMAFSKARVDMALVVATRAALQQMMTDGTMSSLERRYLKDLTP